jgi:hypothetical protein
MKKTILSFLAILAFAAMASAEDYDEINPEVQLQNNGWIKIISSSLEKTPAEEFFKDFPDVSKSREGEIIRQLNVKIQFLKPCKATTKINDKMAEFRAKRHLGENEQLFLNPDIKNPTAEESKVFGMMIMGAAFSTAVKKGDKEEQLRITHTINKEYPDYLDWITPKFYCGNYRTKVFATLFSSKKLEIETQSIIPHAQLVSAGSEERKEEMLPGETMWITFIISDKVTSWKVWVPK